MDQGEQTIKIQIYNEIIGSMLIELNQKEIVNQIRSNIAESTPLYLFDNYHFELDGKPIIEHMEAGKILQEDCRLLIVMDPYDERSSKLHLQRVIKVLDNPYIWATVSLKNSHKTEIDLSSIDPEIHTLDTLFIQPLTSSICRTGEPKKQNSLPEYNDSVQLWCSAAVPKSRRLYGQFFYIHLKLYDTDYRITAYPEGFYVNHSSNPNFNTSNNRKGQKHLSFLNLMLELSCKFKEEFEKVVSRFRISEFEKIFMGYSINSQQSYWLQKQRPHLWRNGSRSKSTNFALPTEDIASVKDWNDHFLSYRLLEGDTYIDRINKQKMSYKFYQQFVECAKQGAAKILDHSLKPLNPHAQQRYQIYLYASIFFTIIQENPYYYSRSPTAKTSKEAINDLNNTILLNCINIPDVSLPEMVIIKLRGFKILGQTMPMPILLFPKSSLGPILQSYRQIVSKSQLNDQEFVRGMRVICRILRVSQNVQYYCQKGCEKRAIGHPDVRYLRNCNNKIFLSDIGKLTARDLNYPGHENELSVLRPELIKIYNERQKSLLSTNSVVGTKYQLKKREQVLKEEAKLLALAKFAKEQMVQQFLEKIEEQDKKYLSDTKGVVKIMHKNGLTSRYLGYILKASTSIHVTIILERVVLLKTAKNIFRFEMRKVAVTELKKVLAHLLNCLFFPDFKYQQPQEESGGFKRRKKKSNKEEEILQIQPSVAHKFPSPKQFWAQVIEIARIRYFHSMPPKQEECQTLKDRFERMALLRDLCLKLGLVLRKEEYLGYEKLVFCQNHILHLRALAKKKKNERKELSQVISEGDKCMKRFQIDQAMDHYSRAMHHIFTLFGGVHQQLPHLHKKMAGIYFRIGELDTAITFAENNCKILETMLGQQNVETIESYNILAGYEFQAHNYDRAERYFLKAIFLARTAYGDAYPELITSYLNLSTVFQQHQRYADAISTLNAGLSICLGLYGNKHLHTSIFYAALANLHFQIPDIEQAIHYQQDCLSVLKGLLSISDNRIKEAEQVLAYYVNVQKGKRVKELHERDQKRIRIAQFQKASMLRLSEKRYAQELLLRGVGGRKPKYFL